MGKKYENFNKEENHMPTENFDVIALGELLIDFTENGLSGQGNR